MIVQDDGAGGVFIAVKAVPGSSRDSIAGALGDRLKVRTSAPPEGGKANKAIAGTLARELGVKARDVELVSGAASAEKTFRVGSMDRARAERALGITGEP